MICHSEIYQFRLKKKVHLHLEQNPSKQMPREEAEIHSMETCLNDTVKGGIITTRQKRYCNRRENGTADKLNEIIHELRIDIIFGRNVEILSSRGLFLSGISRPCQIIMRSCQLSMEFEAYIMLVVPLLVRNVSQHVCDTDSYMVQEASIWCS